MREAVDRLIVNSQNDIAGPQSGVVGRAITIDANDRNFTFFIVGEYAQPWPGRAEPATVFTDLIDDRHQKFYRHEHIHGSRRFVDFEPLNN